MFHTLIKCHQVIHSADWKPSPSLNGRVEELQRPVLASWSLNSFRKDSEVTQNNQSKEKKRSKKFLYLSSLNIENAFLKICPSQCALDKKVIGPNNDSQVCLKKNMLFFNYNWQCHQWETNAVAQNLRLQPLISWLLFEFNHPPLVYL